MRFSFFVTCAALSLSLCMLESSAFASRPKKVLLYMLDGLAANGTYGFQSLLANGELPTFQSLIDGTWDSAYNGAYDPASVSGGEVGTETEQITLTHVSWATVFTGVYANLHETTGDFNSTPANFEDYPPFTYTLRDALGSDIRMTTHARGFFTTRIHPDPAAIFDVVSFQNLPNLYATLNDQAFALEDELIYYYDDDIDVAGHLPVPDGGTNAPGYGEAIKKIDGDLAASLSIISGRPNFANEDWSILVVSDHGHRPEGNHGRQSLDEKETPLIFASKTTDQRELSGTTIASIAPLILNLFDVALPEYYVEDPVLLSDGDYDFDGDTDGYDMLAWQRSLGSTTNLEADGSGNSVVDAADLAVWQLGYRSSQATAVTVVPEPATVTLCATIVAATCLCRRRV